MSIRIKSLDPLALVKQLTIVIFLLIIFDGSLRKWFIPQLSGPLFFIKDVFVLLAYAVAFRYQLFPKATRLVLIAGITFFIFGLLQCIVTGLPLAVMVIGIRNYFLLLPLVMLIGWHYTYEDILKIIKTTCSLGIPIAALVYIQSISSPTSFINKGTGVEEMDVFEVVQGVVRTYGTFSFTDGQVIFINFLFTAVFFVFLQSGRASLFKNWVKILIALCAVLCLAVSGSRGAIANFLILLTGILGAVLLKVNSRRALRFFSLLFLGGLVVFMLGMTLFFDNVQNIQRRFEAASRAENTVERFFSQYLHAAEYLGETTFLGFGLGASSGAGAKLMTGKRGFTLAENEWENILLESGYFFGLIYLSFRIILTGLLLLYAYRAYFETNQLMPVVLAAGVAYLLLQGQVIRGGTPMYFCWFFTGVTIAMIRQNLQVYLSRVTDETGLLLSEATS